MNFLLDHNLPPSWARGLGEFSKDKFEFEVHVFSLREKFSPNTPDVTWLTELGNQGDWVVVSGDFFRKGKSERELIRKFGLNVFVLGKAWHDKHPFWARTAQLVHWWPRIVGQANTVNNTAVEVPWRTSGRFNQINL